MWVNGGCNRQPMGIDGGGGSIKYGRKTGEGALRLSFIGELSCRY
jgi:hypothetical protein